jgi:WXG100 family type VII secretion target
MGADVIQANYEELEAIAARFKNCAEANAELYSGVARGVQALQQGDWQGKGAEAFFAEMNGEIFPALQRLTDALEMAGIVILEIKNIIQQAEEEAAGIFNGDGGGDRSGKKSSGGLRITGMQTINNRELFIADSTDGRAIHPSDAKQGNLGDCFFATSIAVIAEQNPDIIKNAIRDNGNGTYTVTFYEERGGILGIGAKVHPVEITVTPDFPTGERVTNGNSAVVNPHISANDMANGKQEIWAMVVEKAYAQWKGDGNAQNGYIRLDEGGHTSDVLFAVTGQKSVTRDPDSYSVKDLARMEREGYALTLSSLAEGNEGKKELYRNGQLVTKHAYYITNVDEQTGMVTIQNPWGWDERKVTIPYSQLDDNFRAITVNPIKSK